MQHTASYPSVRDQPVSTQRTLAVAGSLLLVSISYVLLLAAPVITRHFGTFAVGHAGLKTLESWLPLACGAGLVLGGASALVFVLTQITREAQKRPYVSLAPVLAAFSACVLIGLRAELPLPGVSSEHVAVFALAVAVVGGALVQTPRVSAQLLGMACTFMPPASLFGVLWILSGSADPARAVWGLPATTRAFLGLLTLSSFAIGAVATLGRRAETQAAEPALLGSRAEPRASTNTRLPIAVQANTLYPGYDLDQSFADDEAALRRRGLPAWVIAVTAVAALVLAFLAMRLYMERRAASSFLERPTPALSERSASPELASPEPAAAVVSAGAPDTTLRQPSQDTPSVAPEAAARLAPAEPARAEAAKVEDSAPALALPSPEPRPSSARLILPEQALHADTKIAPASHMTRAKSRARAPRHATKAASAKVEARGAAREPSKTEEHAESRPAAAVSAKPVKEDSAALALKAARNVSHDDAKPAARASESKPAPAKGDESLDDLMDNVLKQPGKGGSKKSASNDDPIYGL
jgi:hypothetical protein